MVSFMAVIGFLILVVLLMGLVNYLMEEYPMVIAVIFGLFALACIGCFVYTIIIELIKA